LLFLPEWLDLIREGKRCWERSRVRTTSANILLVKQTLCSKGPTTLSLSLSPNVLQMLETLVVILLLDNSSWTHLDSCTSLFCASGIWSRLTTFERRAYRQHLYSNVQLKSVRHTCHRTSHLL
jgi:hypothetical protein